MANNNTFDDSDSEFENDRRSQLGDESDDESLINVDSPADGYFTQRDHPRDTFVENPSQTSEEKAREAVWGRQREAASQSVPATVGFQSDAAPRESAGFDESAPLLDAGPAPPDYYQATAGRGAPPRPYSQGQGRNTSYGSISSPRPSRGEEQAGDGQWRERGFPAAPTTNPVPFSSDHPLVRNGLFDEQGALNSRSQPPQSMRYPATSAQHPQQPPETIQPAQEATMPSTDMNQRSRDERDIEASRQEQVPPYEHHHHHHHYDLAFKKQNKGWRRFCYCCCVPRMGCLNILLIIALIITVVLLTSPNSDDYDDNPHSRLPVGTPPVDKLPIPGHQNTAQCVYDSTSMYRSFDFHDPSNFSFLEMISSSVYSHFSPAGARLSGKIRISPFSEESNGIMDDETVAIRVWVHVAATKPWVVKELSFTKDEDAFELGFPLVEINSRFEEFGTQGWERPCLDFAVLIQVRSDVELSKWELSTANLDVEVQEGIFSGSDPWAEVYEDEEEPKSITETKVQDGLSIQEDTTMYAVRGSISVAAWSSRRTRITTNSGSIEGNFALRDLLEIESHSGSIDVGVEPKKAAKDDRSDAMAELIVKSNSGSVNVECPASHDETQALIPEREYSTRIETSSSSVSGRYLLGTDISFKSSSGQIDVFVLPISANRWNSTLYTDTRSSSTSLNLLEAMSAIPFASGAGSVNPDPPYQSRWSMGSISSTHKSTSGSLSLTYPRHWAGFVEGKSNSGSISVRGKDVKMITDVNAPGHHQVTARKGIGASLLKFKTTSGSVDILIGEED